MDTDWFTSSVDFGVHSGRPILSLDLLKMDDPIGAPASPVFDPFRAVPYLHFDDIDREDYVQPKIVRLNIDKEDLPKPKDDRKPYQAPRGVWRTPTDGFISTIYVAKRRFYGPVRPTVAEATKDRRLMEEVKRRHPNGVREITTLIASMKPLKD